MPRVDQINLSTQLDRLVQFIHTSGLKDPVRGVLQDISCQASSLSKQRTEMRFASFLSGGFITVTVVNQPERKLTKRTSVQRFSGYMEQVDPF